MLCYLLAATVDRDAFLESARWFRPLPEDPRHGLTVLAICFSCSRMLTNIFAEIDVFNSGIATVM